MTRFFHEDNPVIIFLGNVFDLMLLNLLTLVCCLPIITIGASLTAMHRVLVRGIEEKQGDILKPFFGAFRENFMQATLIWIPLLGVLSAAVSCLIVADGMGSVVGLGMGVFAFGLMLVDAMVFLYAFPLLAGYRNTLSGTVRNAVRLAVTHVPQTGAMLAILIVYATLFRHYWEGGLAFVCLFGITVPGWLFMKLYLPVFEEVEGHGEEEGNADVPSAEE